ncbi:MAG: AMP-binding protein [Candidatus Nanopelagicales bacterium]
MLFDRLVFGKLRAALGGHVKYAVSGGAPLGARLGHFFRGIGVTILEGYGLTETSAASTLNRPDAIRIGSVGRPIPGASVKIADDGEVLLKGGQIFEGYWKNEKATDDVLGAGRLVPLRRHRRTRRPGVPADHRAQEGDHRHRRRQERRARGARGPDPRALAGEPVHGGRRQQAVHCGAGDPRPRGRADLVGAA